MGLVILAVLASSLIAQRSLHEHVAAVSKGLRGGGMEAGRKAVSMIVGRNPQSLDEAGVSRAAIESLAENFSDGIVAPAFWIGLGGLTGGTLYKATNTADSMIGHRTPRHEAFGWAAARLDDLVNLPASRLSALLIIAAAALDREHHPAAPSTPSGATPRITARPMPAGPKPQWRERLACGSPVPVFMATCASRIAGWATGAPRRPPTTSIGRCPSTARPARCSLL